MIRHINSIITFSFFAVSTSALFGFCADAAAEAPKVVFLVTEDPSNYNAWETIPVFAKSLEKKYGFQTTVICGEGKLNAIKFPE
jgi:hypothetical protein